RLRMSNQVPLHIITPGSTQPLQLRITLDSLSHNPRANSMREVNDHYDQLLDFRIVAQVFHKAAVEFQDVDREVLEVSERGVSDAEVIERDEHANLTQLFQHPRGVVDVAHRGAFSDLEHDVTGLHVVLAHAALDVLGELLIV